MHDAHFPFIRCHWCERNARITGGNHSDWKGSCCQKASFEMISRLEDLPNELLFGVFKYVDTRDLYRSFWQLNDRLDDILQSLKNLSLKIDQNDLSMMHLFAARVVRLEVNTWHEVDLRRFVNLRSLILRRTTRIQVTQIRPNILPHLTYLSLSLAFDFWSSTQLAQEVFSNGFPSLRYADLGRVDIPYTHSWSMSPHLRSLSVCSSEAVIVSLALASCPHLRHLHVQIFGDRHRIALPSLRINHQLRRFTFFDSYGTLTIDEIDFLLSYIPNLRCIHLTLTEISFVQLAHSLAHRLPHLQQFDILISDSPDEIDLNGQIDAIRKLHPCLERLQSMKKTNGIRHFTNRAWSADVVVFDLLSNKWKKSFSVARAWISVSIADILSVLHHISYY